MFVFYIYGSHHNPDQWKEPFKYIPDRFDHESERGAEDKEMLDISNDTTKEELYQKIDMIMENLFV